MQQITQAEKTDRHPVMLVAAHGEIFLQGDAISGSSQDAESNDQAIAASFAPEALHLSQCQPLDADPAAHGRLMLESHGALAEGKQGASGESAAGIR